MLQIMFEHICFDVENERSVDAGRLGWPSAVPAEGSFGGNRDFYDLSGVGWDAALGLIEEEAGLIARIELAANPDEECDVIADEMYEDPDLLMGLDIGVASSVATLSAAGCLPFASCNGAAFGGQHHEKHPLVAFYAQAVSVPLLLAAAEASGVGMESCASGEVIVYANDVKRMPAFASALAAARDAFDALRMTDAVAPSSER